MNRNAGGRIRAYSCARMFRVQPTGEGAMPEMTLVITST